MADDVQSPGLGVSEDLWEELLYYVEQQQVIPIVGPGLSTVTIEGRTLPTDQYLAEELARRLSPPLADLPPSSTLAEVVARHLERKSGEVRLYALVNSIVADAQFDPPEALVKLAQITDFKLFVTTTLDSLLEAAIDAVRYGGAKTTGSLAYNPKRVEDLRENLRDMAVPTVYHLFGKPTVVPESYVISDGDLLEFIHELQSSDRRPARLFDQLRTNHLLLVGGSMSDWVVRVFLRLAKGQKLSAQRDQLEILADDRWRGDRALMSFLLNFSPQTKMFQAGGPEFIDELWRRWSAKHGAASGAPAPKPIDADRTIFLSYSRRDGEAAKTMRAELEAEGFKVWFDNAELDGQAWDPAIEAEIRRCTVFLPLLSRNTHNELKDAVFRREWSWALERDTRMAESVAFIIPVVIDDMPRGDFDDIPARMRAKDIKRGPGGHVTDEIRRALRKALGDAA